MKQVTSAARLTTLASLATLAVAATFGGPAAAATDAHRHEAPKPAAHGHAGHAAAAPHQLGLNQGRKWATDAPLRAGMQRIRQLVEPGIAAAHAGRLGAPQYAELAHQVEAAVGDIVAQCKLEPQADAMLHLVVADLGAGIEAMAGKQARVEPQQGLVQVATALNAYGRHFQHPGFKPLHLAH